MAWLPNVKAAVNTATKEIFMGISFAQQNLGR